MRKAKLDSPASRFKAKSRSLTSAELDNAVEAPVQTESEQPAGKDKRAFDFVPEQKQPPVASSKSGPQQDEQLTARTAELKHLRQRDKEVGSSAIYC